MRRVRFSCYLLIPRTCVNEEETVDICKGKPLCSNKGDLIWCKETSVESWKPYKPNHNSYCSLELQPERKNLQAQRLNLTDKDNNIYQCLNRLDENPFYKGITLDNDTKNDSEEKWLDFVNTPCPDCLGMSHQTKTY